jgi:hypothetical protein
MVAAVAIMVKASIGDLIPIELLAHRRDSLVLNASISIY